MNKILLFIAVLLVPITIVTKNDALYDQPLDSELLLDDVVNKEVIEEKFVEEDNNLVKNNALQVMVSSNNDKSDAYSVDLEDYIIGVVAGEMPASFSMEALKAQAVASRSYAVYKMKNIPNYILSTTINDQVYLSIDDMKKKWGDDFSYYYDRVKEAVESTKDEVLTYDDQVVIAYYFAISNGYTDDGKTVFNDDKSYLVSVPSTWDKNYSAYSSKRTMDKSVFCSRLNISCDNIVINNVIRADNNYVRSIKINDKTFSGIEVFDKLNLKSTDFKIDVGNVITITTYGFGHGVGMSQYGAQGMAKEGNNYKEILTHYYKNTKIGKI